MRSVAGRGEPVGRSVDIRRQIHFDERCRLAVGNEAMLKFCRKPEIVADAAYVVLSGRSRDRTGQFLIDDEVLAAAGVTDFDRYQVEPGAPLALDFFLDDQGPYIKRVVKLPGSDYG